MNLAPQTVISIIALSLSGLGVVLAQFWSRKNFKISNTNSLQDRVDNLETEVRTLKAELVERDNRYDILYKNYISLLEMRVGHKP